MSEHNPSGACRLAPPVWPHAVMPDGSVVAIAFSLDAFTAAWSQFRTLRRYGASIEDVILAVGSLRSSSRALRLVVVDSDTVAAWGVYSGQDPDTDAAWASLAEAMARESLPVSGWGISDTQDFLLCHAVASSEAVRPGTHFSDFEIHWWAWQDALAEWMASSRPAACELLVAAQRRADGDDRRLFDAVRPHALYRSGPAIFVSPDVLLATGSAEAGTDVREAMSDAAMSQVALAAYCLGGVFLLRREIEGDTDIRAFRLGPDGTQPMSARHLARGLGFAQSAVAKEGLDD